MCVCVHAQESGIAKLPLLVFQIEFAMLASCPSFHTSMDPLKDVGSTPNRSICALVSLFRARGHSLAMRLTFDAAKTLSPGSKRFPNAIDWAMLCIALLGLLSRKLEVERCKMNQK